MGIAGGWVAHADSPKERLRQRILGIIAVADTVRATAARSIVGLKRLGIEQIVMLTGDNQRTAESIGWELGIDKVSAQLLPEAKLGVIRQLQQQYPSVHEGSTVLVILSGLRLLKD